MEWTPISVFVAAQKAKSSSQLDTGIHSFGGGNWGASSCPNTLWACGFRVSCHPGHMAQIYWVPRCQSKGISLCVQHPQIRLPPILLLSRMALCMWGIWHQILLIVRAQIWKHVFEFIVMFLNPVKFCDVDMFRWHQSYGRCMRGQCETVLGLLPYGQSTCWL